MLPIPQNISNKNTQQIVYCSSLLFSLQNYWNDTNYWYKFSPLKCCLNTNNQKLLQSRLHHLTTAVSKHCWLCLEHLIWRSVILFTRDHSGIGKSDKFKHNLITGHDSTIIKVYSNIFPQILQWQVRWSFIRSYIFWFVPLLGNSKSIDKICLNKLL